jgi:hypothetical protein
MPIPIIPKRTRLAESANIGTGSRKKVLAAMDAPAAAALTPRNFLRENSLLFMEPPRIEFYFFNILTATSLK